MNITIGEMANSATDIAQSLLDIGFPLAELTDNPITAIEGMATRTGDNVYRGVCARNCVGCSAEAVHPPNAGGSINVLTPQLLDRILAIAQEFVDADFHILSTNRINFFSGTNEPEHPHCIPLREQLSSYYERNYQCELGAVSDFVFHVAPTKLFRRNLSEGMSKPRLWDNICLAIDEQLPWTSHADHQRFLENLDWVWKTLAPALTRQLDHARPERLGEPRVIVNMLVPGESQQFSEPFRLLYPGGPLRATRYGELIDRYVKPFVGDLITLPDPVPSKHVFTTAIGRLSDVPESKVFISAARYELVGRATMLIDDPVHHKTLPPTTSIRTKIFPTSENQFTVQACRTATPLSEGELPWPSGTAPAWIQRLNSVVIDVSRLR